MPPDGMCGYHAIAWALRTFGIEERPYEVDHASLGLIPTLALCSNDYKCYILL
jgi:hypothetical protein